MNLSLTGLKSVALNAENGGLWIPSFSTRHPVGQTSFIRGVRLVIPNTDTLMEGG